MWRLKLNFISLLGIRLLLDLLYFSVAITHLNHTCLTLIRAVYLILTLCMRSITIRSTNMKKNLLENSYLKLKQILKKKRKPLQRMKEECIMQFWNWKKKFWFNPNHLSLDLNLTKILQPNNADLLSVVKLFNW